MHIIWYLLYDAEIYLYIFMSYKTKRGQVAIAQERRVLCIIIASSREISIDPLTSASTNYRILYICFYFLLFLNFNINRTKH